MNINLTKLLIFLRYTRKRGITEPRKLLELRSLYSQYRENGDRISSLENYFNVSIALIKPEGSKIIKKRKKQNDFIQFERKPSDWSRVAFFAECKNFYYIRMKKEQIFPLLNPKDAILPMQLNAIFPGVEILTSAEFEEQERKLGKIIRIYHLNEDGQIFCPKNRVYGSFLRDDRPMVHLLINDKKLIFTEQAKFRTGFVLKIHFYKLYFNIKNLK